MKFPKIKNASLCRILIYLVVLGVFIAPIVIVAIIPSISETIKVIVGIVFTIGLLFYCIKNLVLLMTMDDALAIIHCYNTARKRFSLPKSFSKQEVEKRIARFGEQCEPTALSPRPDMLRYKSSYPVTIYSSGIEKVISTYNIDFLDKNLYHIIFNSAVSNAKALKGKKKHRFLDKAQKSSPLNCVNVIFIFAKRIDENFRNSLLDVVNKNGGDGFDTATLPCVVDLEHKICIFDSMQIPYTGFQYAVKNRGITIIRKYLFDNKFTYSDSPDMLDPIKDMDAEQSLWDFWRETKRELFLSEKASKKRFEKMEHQEIIFENDWIYLKWEKRGIMVSVVLDDESKTAMLETIDCWYYPKSNKISKDIKKELENKISLYFADMGYTTKYITFE